MESNMWLILLLIFAGLILITWLVVGRRKDIKGDQEQANVPDLDEIEDNTFGADVPPHDHLNQMDATFGGHRPTDEMANAKLDEVHRQEQAEIMQEEQERRDEAVEEDDGVSDFDFVEKRDRDDYMAQPDFNEAEANVVDGPKPPNFDAPYDPEMEEDKETIQEENPPASNERVIGDADAETVADKSKIVESKVYVTHESEQHEEDLAIEREESQTHFTDNRQAEKYSGGLGDQEAAAAGIAQNPEDIRSQQSDEDRAIEAEASGQTLPDNRNSLETVNLETAPLGGMPKAERDFNETDETITTAIEEEVRNQKEAQDQLESEGDSQSGRKNHQKTDIDFSKTAKSEAVPMGVTSTAADLNLSEELPDEKASSYSAQGGPLDHETNDTDSKDGVDKPQFNHLSNQQSEVTLTTDAVGPQEDFAEQNFDQQAIPNVSYKQLINSPTGLKGQRVRLEGRVASYFTEDLGVEGATALASLNPIDAEDADLIALKFVNQVDPSITTNDRIEVEGEMEGLKVNNRMVVPTMRVDKVNKK